MLTIETPIQQRASNLARELNSEIAQALHLPENVEYVSTEIDNAGFVCMRAHFELPYRLNPHELAVFRTQMEALAQDSRPHAPRVTVKQNSEKVDVTACTDYPHAPFDTYQQTMPVASFGGFIRMILQAHSQERSRI